jgi:ABC-type amino acid transport substrate-binding protein
MKIGSAALFGFLLIVCWCNALAETIRLPAETGQRHKLADQLILEVLKRGNLYQPVFPYGDIDSLPLSTRINDVRNGQLDMFYALSTPEYEAEFLAIPFPIYRGMLGWRLAIVKQENVDLFKHVKTLSDLKKFTAGQVTLWSDTAILEANGLPVVKEHSFSNLFRMLEADRFDYFPRGIHEPWLEVQREAALNLVVEPYVVLQYRVPFYFFVSKRNTALAAHIHTQLEAMLADGSFDRIFYANSEVKMAIEKSNLKQRVVISLENPYLSPQTPIHRPELWLSAEDLQRF